MEKEYICKSCGKPIPDGQRRVFDGTLMCQDCFDSSTTVCSCCGKRIWNEDSHTDSEIALCHHCYDYEYVRCEDCGRLVPNNEACYYDDEDYPYCGDCMRRRGNETIKSYYYKPEPIFYGSGNLFMGVELEIDKGGEDADNAETILNVANQRSEHIYAKHDGSIEDGFEIVSHPMTLTYHRETMNWQGVFETALDYGYRSHQTHTCGLHIHVNRNAFSDIPAVQESVVSRIVYFVEKHWNELLKFSRRTEENINRWARRYGIANTAKDTYDNAKSKHMGRYVAVNLENHNTIEFRMFRGTLYYSTFMATLQLVDEICSVAYMMNDKEVEGLSWSEFVSRINKNTKPELINYLKIKRLYVNEITEEGVDM